MVMSFHRLLTIFVLMLVAVAISAKAQTNVAVCDVDKVLSELDERRDGEAELKRERSGFLEDREHRLNRLRPGLDDSRDVRSPEDIKKERLQLEIFVRVQEWRLNTKENGLIQRLDQKITAACKLIAEQKKIDLVLFEHTPVIPADLTTLKPEELRALLKQKAVAYMSEKTDITNAVIAQLNADYAKSDKR